MDTLGWLYANGGWAWMLLVVPLAWIGGIGGRWLIAHRAARRSRAARVALTDGASTTQELSPTSGGQMVVRGTLVALDEAGEATDATGVVAWTAGGTRTEPGEGHGRAAATLAIALDDGPVLLEGALEIVAGSREAVGVDDAKAAAWIASEGGPALGVSGQSARIASVRAVAIGDPVIARGPLTEDAGAGHDRSSYRTASVQRTLGPGVRLACSRAPRIVLSGPRAALVGAAGALVVGVAFLFLGGQAALAVATAAYHGLDEGSRHAPRTGAELSALSVAASSPFTRRAALRELLAEMRVDELDAAPRRTTAERVYLLAGDCQGAVDMWRMHGDPDRADSLADRCGISLQGADAAFARGDFEAASHGYVQEPHSATLQSAMAHLAAQQPTLASLSLQIKLAQEPPDDGASRDRAEALRCIADALDARVAENPNAQARLLAAVPHRAMCRVLYADLVHGEERREVLHPSGAEVSDDDALWTDGAGMAFANDWVLAAARALHEEELGLLRVPHDALRPQAALVSPSGESPRRSYVPVGLLHAIGLTTSFVPGDGDRLCQAVRGNEVLFLATLGDLDEARALAARIAGVDQLGIESVLDTIALHPERASRWATTGHDPAHRGLYHAMDDAVARRFAARERGDQVAEARDAAVVRRFRDVIFNRTMTVPLQMLEAFAER